MMKPTRYHVPLLLVALLLVAVVRVLTGDVEAWREWQQLKHRQKALQIEIGTLGQLHDHLLRLVPEARQSLQPVDRLVLTGGIVLANQARAANLLLDTLTIRGGNLSSEVDLRSLATPVPYTNGHLRRLYCEMKLGFSSLGDLAGFVATIPAGGGYLAAVHVQQKRAMLLIGFLGS